MDRTSVEFGEPERFGASSDLATKPLITAAEAFPALEQLAVGAQESLWLGFRVFDPRTRLRAALFDGCATWCDLLEKKLAEGVEIRILLSDFDALGRAELHRATWDSVEILRSLPSNDRLHVFPALHPARMSVFARCVFWPLAAAAVLHRRDELNRLPPNDRAEQIARAPGLWRALRLRGDGRVRWAFPTVPALTPTTLHQKIAIADSARAVIGGIDIDERRYDTPDHDRPAEETWRDVSLLTGSRIAAPAARHFAEVWNGALARNRELRQRQWQAAPPSVASAPPDPETCPIAPLPAEERPSPLLRTKSGSGGPWGLFPREKVTELETAHIDLIRRAERTLYIETQFLRSSRVARTLADAGRRRGLELVLILPAAPEDVAFKGRLSVAERFGDHLQARALSQIKAAFGSRAAVLSPARAVSDPQSGRQSLHGAEIIYVHSKVLIQDDAAAIVSSANLNGRSLRWDTEAGALLTDRADVAALMRACVESWKGDYPVAPFRARDWHGRAMADLRRHPEARHGVLLPHDPKGAERDAVPLPGAPEEAV